MKSRPPRYDDVYTDGIDQWEADIKHEMSGPHGVEPFPDCRCLANDTQVSSLAIPIDPGVGGPMIAVVQTFTDKQALELALAVIREVDYDIWKDYQLETAEMPEDIPEMRQALIRVVQGCLTDEGGR